MIEFFRVIETGITPTKASTSANGSLPTNGFRYCEPVRTASSFGWYIFLPLEFWLIWDGAEFQWSLDRAENWYVLGDAIQYPNFSSAFDEAAIDEVKGYSPPFLKRTNEVDTLQIWTGLFAKSEPGIASYIRSPVNLHQSDFIILEGVVQTEWWFGPLFANVKILKKDRPIIFRTSVPFIQVQPFSNDVFETFKKSEMIVHNGLEKMGPHEWEAYQSTIVRRMETRVRLGDYAVEARKKRK